MRLSACALALCLTAGCGDDGGGGATQTYRLVGTVTDALSDDPVKGATVTFTSDTLDSKSTRTNGDGDYALTVETDVPFGQVRVEKDGYQPAEASVFFDAPARRVDIQVREALPDAGL